MQVTSRTAVDLPHPSALRRWPASMSRSLTRLGRARQPVFHTPTVWWARVRGCAGFRRTISGRCGELIVRWVCARIWSRLPPDDQPGRTPACRSGRYDDGQLRCPVRSTRIPARRASAATAAASAGSARVTASSRATRPLCALLKWLTTVRRAVGALAEHLDGDRAGHRRQGGVRPAAQVDDETRRRAASTGESTGFHSARSVGQAGQRRARGEPVGRDRVVGARPARTVRSRRPAAGRPAPAAARVSEATSRAS